MPTHVIAKRDADERVYRSIVVAPDHPSALRLFSMEMLTALGTTLDDQNEKSLIGYADPAFLDEDWTAEPGRICPSCSSSDVRRLGAFEMAECGLSPVIHADRASTCISCAHIWIDIGTMRQRMVELEEDAEERLRKIDEFERNSLAGEV